MIAWGINLSGLSPKNFGISANLPKARSLLPLLREFLLHPLAAARGGQPFAMEWKSGGPWRKKAKPG